MRCIFSKARALSFLCAAAVLVSCAPAPTEVSSACEPGRPVIFGGLDWDSNAFHTEVARYIVEHGYDCPTDVIPGSTIPLNSGLVRGDVDVLMEIWQISMPDVLRRGIEKGQVLDLGTNFPDAVQGFYVPRYVIEGDAARAIEPVAPDLKSIFDLPKYKALFTDPEEPYKGRFYNCVLGWACEVTNTRKLRAYGLTQDFTNFRPGTAAALDAAIVGAIKRGEPVVAYYWGPTWIMGAYDLVRLEEPPFDPAVWSHLQNADDPNRACAYPPDEVTVGVNAAFAGTAPDITAFLTAYRTDAAQVSEALAYMQQGDGRTAADAALHFLRTQMNIWSGWVGEGVRAKVEAALAEERKG